MKYFVHATILTATLFALPLSMPQPAAAAQAVAATNDADITAKIKAQIDAEAELKGSDITVTTTSGLVTLNGSISSPVLRAKVGELTKATPGVTNVNNKIKLSKAKK